MAYIIYNGKLLPENTPVAGADNPALKFGDGLFETMRYHNGEIALWEKHMLRFFNGLKSLKFQYDKHFTKQLLLDQVIALLQKNRYTDARIRLTAFRRDAALFDYVIQTWALDADFGKFNENGLQLCIYRDAKKHCDFLSNIKHNNYLLPVMASFCAKEQNCNDAVLLNQHERICETTITNIFILRDKMIITPSLSEGCVAGTMRSLLLELLPQIGIKIEEGEISEEDLLTADEVFVTNALKPIRRVASCEGHSFENRETKKMVQRLKSMHPGIFI